MPVTVSHNDRSQDLREESNYTTMFSAAAQTLREYTTAEEDVDGIVELERVGFGPRTVRFD